MRKISLGAAASLLGRRSYQARLERMGIERIRAIARENGKLVLKLKSGVEAPVSRTYLPSVREKGWV